MIHLYIAVHINLKLLLVTEAEEVAEAEKCCMLYCTITCCCISLITNSIMKVYFQGSWSDTTVH